MTIDGGCIGRLGLGFVTRRTRGGLGVVTFMILLGRVRLNCGRDLEQSTIFGLIF
ncbi:hypothetical protein OROMI_026321 [Orobanche minor]